MTASGPPHPLDDGVRGCVVGDGDHQLDRVAKRQPVELELLENAAAGSPLGARRQDQLVVEPRAAPAHELERGARDRHLDHRGGGERLVLPQPELRARLEVDGVIAEPARERPLERGDSLLERQLGTRRDRDEVAGGGHQTQV